MQFMQAATSSDSLPNLARAKLSDVMYVLRESEWSPRMYWIWPIPNRIASVKGSSQTGHLSNDRRERLYKPSASS
jgi:hypothetical protein